MFIVINKVNKKVFDNKCYTINLEILEKLNDSDQTEEPRS